MTMEDNTYCGFVAILGRPNVGKSSLLNAILSKKVSITSYRPQTTRHQILGIKTENNIQTVFVDTPGLHLDSSKALNRHMNKAAHQSLIDVNAVIWVVEALKFTEEDEYVGKLVQKQNAPLIIAINKIDLVEDKEKLLQYMQKLNAYSPHEMIPLSVKKRIQLELIEKICHQYLPESPFYFPEDQNMNHSESFHSAETVREKLMRYLEKELPYSVTVCIESFQHLPNILHIHALIVVEREGQKQIIIGTKGEKLKEIGQSARIDLEKFFCKKVCLKLWVKVSEKWSDNAQALKNYGYSL